MKKQINQFLSTGLVIVVFICLTQCTTSTSKNSAQSDNRLAPAPAMEEMVVAPAPPFPAAPSTESAMIFKAVDQHHLLTKSRWSSQQKEGQPSHNTEDYSAIQENEFQEVTKAPLSTFSIDVDAASYSNLRRFIQNGQMPPKDAVRIEEMINYFDYDYPQPKGDHPFEVITEMAEFPWNNQHRLVHIGLQGKHIPTDNLPASN